MPNFWSRRKERKRGLPELLAPETVDFGISSQEHGPKDWLGNAKPWQLEVDDPEFSMLCQHRRPGKGCWLSRVRRWLWLLKGGKHTSQGFGKSCRASGMRAEVRDVPGCAWWEETTADVSEFQRWKFQQELNARSVIQPLSWDEPSAGCKARERDVPRCARMEEKALEKLEKPGACQNSGGGKAQQEKLDICSMIQPLKEDSWDELSAGCKARDGDVPREGGGHGNGMDQIQLPVQAGASEDEEGWSSDSPQIPELHVEDRDAPTIPGKDLEPPPAEGTSGEEPRCQMWEKLEHLGEATEGWEGKPLEAMAAGLVEPILQTHTQSYPTEQGSASRPCSRQLGTGNAIMAEATAQQDLGVSVSRSEPCFLGMLGIVGSSDSSDSSDGSDDSGELGLLPMCFHILQVEIKNQWRMEFPAVWARCQMDCGKVAEEVDLDGAPVPFQRQRPLSPYARNIVRELLPEFLKEGIVVEGRSDSNNPLVPKRKGPKWCLNLDCRVLNATTPMEPPESLDKDQILASIPAGSRYFSVLDLSCACFAIPLARSCWHRFAFTFQGRQFLFTRLPLGFWCTSSIVHRRVARMLSRLEQGDDPWAFNYMDDILITGKTPQEVAARTRRVLELIQETGFKAKFEKAQLVRTQVKYLGITIGATGREIPDTVVEELRNARRPWNARQLSRLLGKFGSWKDHIPDYWELVLPLHRLTGDRARWEWGQKQQWELRELKEALVSVLRFPDRSKPFLIRMSIHLETAGATLLQDEGGFLVPVRHISCILRGQGSFSLEEKGCVAAAWAVQKFQSFTGSAPILLQLPHSPGKFVSRGQALGSHGPRLPEQWALLLLPEQAEEKKCNFMEFPRAPPVQLLLQLLLRLLPYGVSGSDGISRSNVWFLASCRSEFSIGFAATNLEGRWLLGASRGGSKLDAELGALQELLEQHRSSSHLYLYSSCESLLEWLRWRRSAEEGWNSRATWKSIRRWFNNNPGKLQLEWVRMDGSEEREESYWMGRAGARAQAAAARDEIGWKTWEPSEYERQEIISQCHQRHEGVEETLARVLEVGSWEGARRDVELWVRECPRCGDGGAGPQRAEGPWSRLSIGLAGGLPETAEGFRALLAVRDEVSGWVEAFPLREQAERAVIPLLLRDVFGRLGKVLRVRVPEEPRWLWSALSAAPLRRYRQRLERCRRCPVTASLRRVALKVGKGWAEMLPLILAGIRAGRAHRARLEPLLCVPGLALEMLWEEREVRDPRRNELARLGGMRVLPGYRDRVEAALRGEPRTDPA